MTLNTVKREAYNAGYRDAMLGRLYRSSFIPGNSLRTLQLHAEYEAGWQTGRKQR